MQKKRKPEPKSKSGGTKAEGKGQGKDKIKSEEKDDEKVPSTGADVLTEEPMKTFLHLAQQELRVYIALENAWPRMKEGVMQKTEVPLDIMNKLIKKHEKYRTQPFQATYRQVCADPKMKNKMAKYVSILTFLKFLHALISTICRSIRRLLNFVKK